MKKSEKIKKSEEKELPIVQKAYDLIKWYVPILNRLPRDHKFGLGERIVAELYDILEGLVLARYASDKQHKLELLQPLSGKLNLLTYQTRLLFDFKLMDLRRYEYVSSLLDELGRQLTGWISQQQERE
jgi:hypothetical protein